MREYWINVYDLISGVPHSSLKRANSASVYYYKLGYKTLYRIHVILK